MAAEERECVIKRRADREKVIISEIRREEERNAHTHIMTYREGEGTSSDMTISRCWTPRHTTPHRIASCRRIVC